MLDLKDNNIFFPAQLPAAISKLVTLLQLCCKVLSSFYLNMFYFHLQVWVR